MPLASLIEWLKSTQCKVYASNALSNWGDRMWSFAIAIFLIKLFPDSLRLVAVYGVTDGVAVLVFAAVIGDWVDRNPRLRAVRLTLICQNSLVVISAIIILIQLHWSVQINSVGDGKLRLFLFALVILVAVLARLAGVGNRISLQKDWVVVICKGDKDKLANMTSTLRRIDLVCKILAPVVTGQIIYFTSDLIACCFIGAWNVVSMFAEYYLLLYIYHRIPELAQKTLKKDTPDEPKNRNEGSEMKLLPQEKGDDPENPKTTPPPSRIRDGDDEDDPLEVLENLDTVKKEPPPKDVPVVKVQKQSKLTNMCRGLKRLYSGWPTYMKYKVALAGAGLSCLYMTVLGFDKITVGYAYSQNISEWILGILQAAGSVVGIAGTFAYPVIRKMVGLERTGLISFTLQLSLLILCVVSVWAPGSPFDPWFYSRPSKSINETIFKNSSSICHISKSMSFNQSAMNITDGSSCIHRSYESIVLLLTGITLARFALWISDLTITQLLLENAHESERGAVHGVQEALNMLMDLIKYVLVVFMPHPEVFGYLVLLSFFSIFVGACFYSAYSFKVRGHILPHFCSRPCSKDNGTSEAMNRSNEPIVLR